jgi:hypothetical protein
MPIRPVARALVMLAEFAGVMYTVAFAAELPPAAPGS